VPTMTEQDTLTLIPASRSFTLPEGRTARIDFEPDTFGRIRYLFQIFDKDYYVLLTLEGKVEPEAVEAVIDYLIASA
jgi:hypothetical protein